MRISSCTISFCTLRNHYNKKKKKKQLFAPQRKVAISLQAVPNTYIIFQSFTRQESSGECGVTSPNVSYNHHEPKRRLVFALRRSQRGKSAAFVSYLSPNAGWFVCCARGQRRQVDKNKSSLGKLTNVRSVRSRSLKNRSEDHSRVFSLSGVNAADGLLFPLHGATLCRPAGNLNQ